MTHGWWVWSTLRWWMMRQVNSELEMMNFMILWLWFDDDLMRWWDMMSLDWLWCGGKTYCIENVEHWRCEEIAGVIMEYPVLAVSNGWFPLLWNGCIPILAPLVSLGGCRSHIMFVGETSINLVVDIHSLAKSPRQRKTRFVCLCLFSKFNPYVLGSFVSASIMFVAQIYVRRIRKTPYFLGYSQWEFQDPKIYGRYSNQSVPVAWPLTKCAPWLVQAAPPLRRSGRCNKSQQGQHRADGQVRRHGTWHYCMMHYSLTVTMKFIYVDDSVSTMVNSICSVL